MSQEVLSEIGPLPPFSPSLSWQLYWTSHHSSSYSSSPRAPFLPTPHTNKEHDDV